MAPSRLLNNDAAPSGHDRRARDKDAGSANSSAIGATENAVSRRPARPGGRGVIVQQPPSGPRTLPSLVIALPEQDGPVVDARHLLAVSRALHPGRSWSAFAQTIYMTAIAFGLAAVLFWSLWKRVAHYLVDVANPYHIFWGAAAVALILLAAVRYSTLQGFVSYSEADCLFLLSAPVPRRRLNQPRLRRMALALAVGGAIVGVLAALASGGLTAGPVAMVEGAVAGSALGVIVVAAGWHVQRLPAATTWVLRLTIPALGLVALLALGDRLGTTAHLATLWSGPWGWGLLPLARSNWVSGLGGVLLLCALAAVGWISVRLSAGAASLEGFLARAQTRSQMVAAVYAFDARSVMLASRRPWAERWRARLRFRVPHRPGLAVPWHGSLVLLRSPLRLAWGIALTGAGVLLFGVQPGRTGASWAGAVALYLAASSLAEPLRLEVDQGATSATLLPWRFGRTLRLHCLVPVTVLLVTELLAILMGWAAGFVAASTVPPLLIVAIPAAFVVVFAAALSSRRGGRMPQQMLLVGAGDSTGMSAFLLVGWLFGWAVFAVVAVAVSALVLAHPGSLMGSVSFAAGLLAVVAYILSEVLVRSKR